MESAPDMSPCSCCRGARAFSTCAMQTLQLVSRETHLSRACILCAAVVSVAPLCEPAPAATAVRSSAPVQPDL